MKLCVSCVYWTLILISVVSSGLLFLIVASEGIQSTERSSVLYRNESFVVRENTSVDDPGGGHFGSSRAAKPDVRLPIIGKRDREDHRIEKEATRISASFETPSNSGELKKEDGLEILKESLTQQPNLSQGISETGQAVVVTLVDTATTELRSLAEPRIVPDFKGSRSIANESTKTTSPLPKDRIPPSSVLRHDPAPSTLINGTLLTEDDTIGRQSQEEGEEESSAIPEVVVVRAERKIDSFVEDQVVASGLDSEDEAVIVGKSSEAPATAPELNDSAARARLMSGGAGDDPTSAVLDGLVTAGPSDPHEDIPSFSEWAQKRLEEAEKKKTHAHPNVSVQSGGATGGRGIGGMKIRSKNYASPDCGAKIVAANPESSGAKSVLVSSRDEYMLNTCTSRVWFVVELCEAIQAKKIELANFELFSSSPKDFSVLVSDRFPSRDWRPVGQFTAKDERDIQSFAVHPQLFGKFIKVELHSHYGSEHFCPVSLFRVYGTSEFEVLETESRIQEPVADVGAGSDDEEEEEEEEAFDDDGVPSGNLFGSARDAVLSIVKKAAEVLVKSSDLAGNNITKIQESIENTIFENSSFVTSCATPRYAIVCNHCSDDRFARVFRLVSCRDRYLDALLKVDLFNRTLRESNLCSSYGVEFGTRTARNGMAEEREELLHEEAEDYAFDLARNVKASFLTSVFAPEYIVALCNVLATKERKVVLNVSHEDVGDASQEATTKDDAGGASRFEAVESTVFPKTTVSCATNVNSPGCKETLISEEARNRSPESHESVEPLVAAPIEAVSTSDTLASQIRPTKTLNEEEPKGESSVPMLEPSRDPAEENAQSEVLTMPSPLVSAAVSTAKSPGEPSSIGTSLETATQTVVTPIPSADTEETAEAPDVDSIEAIATAPQAEPVPLGEPDVKISAQDQMTFDTLLSDLKDLEGEPATLQNNQASSASSASQPASSPQQKESVFLRLSNRIKTLERNMSLSGQYLEELSRRYKKQVEEMQRSLERAVTAMGEESRRGEERDSRRLEEIAILREEIATLSESVQALLYDREGWRGRLSVIGQHVVLVCVEIVIVILILSYCRRSVDLDDEEESTSARKEIKRRKSVDGQAPPRRTKKRRPSEIAAHIAGSYHELLIEDRSSAGDSRKDRKKKRKRDSLTRIVANGSTNRRDAVRHQGSTNLASAGGSAPTRRASSSDANNRPIDPGISSNSRRDSHRRVGSAPERPNGGWFDDQIAECSRKLEAEPVVAAERNSDIGDREAACLGESDSSSSLTVDPLRSDVSNEPEMPPGNNCRSGGILKSAKLSSPSFMKTALGSRKKRLSPTGTSQRIADSKSENWEWYSKLSSSSRSSQESPALRVLTEVVGINGNASNGHVDDSDESRSGSSTPASGKKEKKSTGLKKMVKKLF